MESLKRARSSNFENLNITFSSFVQNNIKKSNVCNLIDAANDYLGYVELLENRYDTESQLKLYSFGSNECGQCGVGVDNAETDLEITLPRLVDTFPSSRKVRCLASGGLSNILCDSENKVYTWGCADEDALGREGDENIPLPVQLPSSVVVVNISCGDSHGAISSLHGQVYWWGSFRDKDGKTWVPALFASSDDGEESSSPNQGAKKPPCGPGRTQSSPRLLTDVSGIVDVCSGSQHMLLLKDTGVVLSMGMGEQGQLGRNLPRNGEMKVDDEYDVDSIERNHLTLSKMEINEEIKALGCGAYHSLLISVQHSRVFACGLNQYRQVCSVEKNVITTPTLITALNDKHVSFVTGGEHFSLAKTTFGDLYTWGRSDQSQLGYKIANEEKAGSFRAIPTRIENIPKMKAVCCGSSFVLCATFEGELYSWGFGEMMQLGNGQNKDEPIPKKQKFDKKVIKLSAGGQHSTVLVE